MSLVINSNDSGRPYEVANSQSIGVSGYPDFNQILLHPTFPTNNNQFNGSFYPPNNDTFPTTGDYVKKLINGTPINFWSDDILAPSCFIGSGSTVDDGGYGSQSIMLCSSTFQYRIGINKPLPAGLEIGKYIYGMYTIGCNSSNIKPFFSITIGLLHADGTLTKLPPILAQQVTTAYNQGASTRCYEYSQENSNGLITQEGDYVIMEIDNTGGGTWGLSFGRSGGPRNNNQGSSDPRGIRAMPCQISIE